MSQGVKKGVAIIGLGAVAVHYFEAINTLSEVRLSAVVEPFCRVQLPKEVLLVPSVKELLRSEGHPEYAIICTPPKSHYQVTEALLEAGVNCLVEKPLAIDSESAQALYSLAAKNGVKLLTAGKFRIALKNANQEIEDGRIGKLQGVENTFCSPYQADQNWRVQHEVSGGGVWMDNGPHALDVLETLAGPIEKLRMVKSISHPNFPQIDETVVVETIHLGGVKGKTTLSWKEEIKAPIAICTGSDGEMQVVWSEYNRLDCFQQLIRDLIGEQSIEDHGLKTLKWVEKGYLSLSSGKWEGMA